MQKKINAIFEQIQHSHTHTWGKTLVLEENGA